MTDNTNTDNRGKSEVDYKAIEAEETERVEDDVPAAAPTLAETTTSLPIAKLPGFHSPEDYSRLLHALLALAKANHHGIFGIYDLGTAVHLVPLPDLTAAVPTDAMRSMRFPQLMATVAEHAPSAAAVVTTAGLVGLGIGRHLTAKDQNPRAWAAEAVTDDQHCTVWWHPDHRCRTIMARSEFHGYHMALQQASDAVFDGLGAPRPTRRNFTARMTDSSAAESTLTSVTAERGTADRRPKATPPSPKGNGSLKRFIGTGDFAVGDQLRFVRKRFGDEYTASLDEHGRLVDADGRVFTSPTLAARWFVGKQGAGPMRQWIHVPSGRTLAEWLKQHRGQ